jgi:hypothetical protein
MYQEAARPSEVALGDNILFILSMLGVYLITIFLVTKAPPLMEW